MPLFNEILGAAITYNTMSLINLIKKGACLDEAKGLWTPAAWLVIQKKQKAADFLISYGADVDPVAMAAASIGNMEYAYYLHNQYGASLNSIAQGAAMNGCEIELNVSKAQQEVLFEFIFKGAVIKGDNAFLEKLFNKYQTHINIKGEPFIKEFYFDLSNWAAFSGHHGLKEKLLLKRNHPMSQDEKDSLEIHSIASAHPAEYKKSFDLADIHRKWIITAGTVLGGDIYYVDHFIHAFPWENHEKQYYIDFLLEYLIERGQCAYIDYLLETYPILQSNLFQLKRNAFYQGYFTFVEKLCSTYSVPHHPYPNEHLRLYLSIRFPKPSLVLNALKTVESIDFCKTVLENLFKTKNLTFIQKEKVFHELNVLYEQKKKYQLTINQIYTYATHKEIMILLFQDAILRGTLPSVIFNVILTYLAPIHLKEATHFSGPFIFQKCKEFLMKDLHLINAKNREDKRISYLFKIAESQNKAEMVDQLMTELAPTSRTIDEIEQLTERHFKRFSKL